MWDQWSIQLNKLISESLNEERERKKERKRARERERKEGNLLHANLNNSSY
jgi:hypothetical protein